MPCSADSGPAHASPLSLPRTSLAAGPPGPDSPALLVCLPCGAAFGFRLRPCLRLNSRPTLGTCIRFSLPAPALRRCVDSACASPSPCLELVSGSRLLQHFRPEPATSHRLSILWPPSCLDSKHVLRPAPFPALRSHPQFSLATAPVGFAFRLSFRSELAPLAPLDPPAAFRLRRLTLGSRPSSPAIPSGQPSGLPLSGASALASAPSW